MQSLNYLADFGYTCLAFLFIALHGFKNSVFQLFWPQTSMKRQRLSKYSSSAEKMIPLM